MLAGAAVGDADTLAGVTVAAGLGDDGDPATAMPTTAIAPTDRPPARMARQFTAPA
jgi:hypothetical protein